MHANSEWLFFRSQAIPQYKHNHENASNSPAQKEEIEEEICGDFLDEAKKNIIRSVDNYFPVEDANSLLGIIAKLRGNFNQKFTEIENQLSAFKTNFQCLESPQSLNNPYAKRSIKLCFTKRWRKMHSTIFLLVSKFKIFGNQDRMRVLVCDIYGCVMFVLSSIKCERNYEELIYCLNKNYKILKKIVIIYTDLETHEIDLSLMESIQARINLQCIAIAAFKPKPKKILRSQSMSQNLKRQYFYQSQLIDLIFLEQGDCLFVLSQSIESCEFLVIKKNVKEIQETEEYLLDILFGSISQMSLQLNIKQFNLRLFSFYFNFLVVSEELKILPNSEKTVAVNFQIQKSICNSIKTLTEQKQQKQEMKHCHFPKLLDIPTSCLVCSKGKPKYGCIACLLKYNKTFGLCPIDCFKKFHLDEEEFSIKLKKQKKTKSKLIQYCSQKVNPPKQLAKDLMAQAETPENKLPSTGCDIESQMDSIKCKWEMTLSESKQILDEFKRNCEAGMFSELMMAKANYFNSFQENLKMCEEPVKIQCKQQYEEMPAEPSNQ